jgi:hypothetical protein
MFADEYGSTTSTPKSSSNSRRTGKLLVRESLRSDRRAQVSRKSACRRPQSRWIADLIALLADKNADVRFHAARGLERLTGRDQGCEGHSWQAASWATCEGPYQKWFDWWAANRDRYPTARQDIPAAATPPY